MHTLHKYSPNNYDRRSPAIYPVDTPPWRVFGSGALWRWRGSVGSKLRRTLRPTVLVFQAHGMEVLEHSGMIHIFGEAISGIVCTKHFVDNQVFLFDFLLDPKQRGVQVSDLAYAKPTTNAQCGSRIAPNAKVERYAQISRY